MEAQPHMLDAVASWLDHALQNGHKKRAHKHNCSKRRQDSSLEQEVPQQETAEGCMQRLVTNTDLEAHKEQGAEHKTGTTESLCAGKDYKITRHKNHKRDFMQDSGYASGANSGEILPDQGALSRTPSETCRDRSSKPTLHRQSSSLHGGPACTQGEQTDTGTCVFSVEADVHSSFGFSVDSVEEGEVGERTRLLGNTECSKADTEQARKHKKDLL